MDMRPIEGSSRIRAYGWELTVREPRHLRAGLLQLEFTDGARWFYYGVPESVLEAFLMARSKGSFFARNIQRSFEQRPADEVERVQSGA